MGLGIVRLLTAGEQGKLLKNEPSVFSNLIIRVSVPSFECLHLFFPARALPAPPWLHPRDALFHSPNPSLSFGMSLASLGDSRKLLFGISEPELLSHFWENAKKLKVLRADVGQPTPSTNPTGFGAGTGLVPDLTSPKPILCEVCPSPGS